MFAVALAGNKYMFYLAAATQASGTGGEPKPLVITRSRVVSVTAGDAERPKKSVRGAGTDEVPIGGREATSSHFKRKSTNVVAPSMLYYYIIVLFPFMSFCY